MDEDGIIVLPRYETLPDIAEQIDPAGLFLFVKRLIVSAYKKRRTDRWKYVNQRRLELARLCIDRMLTETFR